MRTLSFAGALLVCSLAALAQSDRGTITGTVADPAGAVLAATPVEIRNRIPRGSGGWRARRQPAPEWCARFVAE